MKEITDKLISSKSEASALQKTMSREFDRETTFVKETYLLKDCYSKYTKNS